MYKQYYFSDSNLSKCSLGIFNELPHRESRYYSTLREFRPLTEYICGR